MKVTLDIPDRLGWVLSDHAERKGTTLAHLISGLVIKTWMPNPDDKPLTFRDRVAAEWSKGAPDPVIAHRLGEPLGSVRDARRALGYKPHKFRRDQWQDELGRANVRPFVLGQDAA